jgi:hypothetical protein
MLKPNFQTFQPFQLKISVFGKTPDLHFLGFAVARGVGSLGSDLPALLTDLNSRKKIIC